MKKQLITKQNRARRKKMARVQNRKRRSPRLVSNTRIQVRSATLRHLSSHAHFLEYDGRLLKA